MKTVKFFNWLKSIFKTTETLDREIDKEDPYATIKHKTQTLGFRHHRLHNNRKSTKGRNAQYVTVNGRTKPIYHTVI